MADVFISYAREDIELTERLARVLQGEGHSVWWDTHMEVGEKWRKRIDTELHAARAVIVLWSKASLESDYVVDEAAVGRRRGCLVPISIDGSEPPIGFRGIGASACTRELERLRPRSPLVAEFVQQTHVPRCQQRNPPG